MAERLDLDWKSCEIAEHLEMHNGECLVTGRHGYCIECPYRNALATDAQNGIDFVYEAKSGSAFKF